MTILVSVGLSVLVTLLILGGLFLYFNKKAAANTPITVRQLEARTVELHHRLETVERSTRAAPYAEAFFRPVINKETKNAG